PYYENGVEVFEKIRERNSKYQWGRRLLMATYRCYIESLISLKRFDDALKNLNSLDAVYRDHQFDAEIPIRNRLRRPYLIVKLGKPTEAIKLTEDVLAEVEASGSPFAVGEASYYAASVYAALVESDESKPDQHAARSIELLKTALQHEYDYCDVRELDFREDPDFDAIRAHSDFPQ
ncbi:MAG: hypothetical protein AAF497_19075, partial [Planctomycetota bacterium]